MRASLSRTTVSRVAATAAAAAVALGAGPAAYADCGTGQSGEFANHKLVVFPDDGHQIVYDFINSATSSIDMTMYELEDTTVTADLIAAEQRGVKVRVILDGRVGPSSSYYSVAYKDLTAAGISVVWSSSAYYYTHQKTITVDGRESLILTGNLVSYYYPSDRDYGVFDTDPWDVRAVEQTFDADFTDTAISPSAGDGDLVWSPTTAKPTILSLINGARHSLLIEEEEMYDPDVVDALAAAAQRGVDVQLVIITECDLDPYLNTLIAAGVHVSQDYNSTDSQYAHAKAIVADYGSWDQRVEVGSINISTTSLTQNRELGILLDGRDAATRASVDRLDSVISADFAAATPYTYVDPSTITCTSSDS